MRIQALVMVVIGIVGMSATLARAQDDRLPVIRPQVETVKASPAPFPVPEKTAADYDTWIRTPWIQMNSAKCGESCSEVSIRTITGSAQIDTKAARRGPAKLRLGVVIPATCGDYVWYGEMRDQRAIGTGLKDPSDPIESARIHAFRFDDKSREITMVFQNDHAASPRQARLNVLCKAK